MITSVGSGDAASSRRPGSAPLSALCGGVGRTCRVQSSRNAGAHQPTPREMEAPMANVPASRGESPRILSPGEDSTRKGT